MMDGIKKGILKGFLELDEKLRKIPEVASGEGPAMNGGDGPGNGYGNGCEVGCGSGLVCGAPYVELAFPRISSVT